MEQETNKHCLVTISTALLLRFLRAQYVLQAQQINF